MVFTIDSANVSGPGDAQRRAEELLRAIVDGTAAVTGTAFFGSLVQHLARALGVRRVYVAECLDADHARARARCARCRWRRC